MIKEKMSLVGNFSVRIHALSFFVYFDIVSDIAIFVLKRDVKLQLTNYTLILLVGRMEGHSAC